MEPIHLVLPYHKKTRGLKQLFAERGIEVIYTSRYSLGIRVTWRKRAPMESGVYILKCIDSSCDKVYVGESSYFPRRFDEHRWAIGGVPCMNRYATARHKHPGSGLMLDPDNALIPYRSSSLLHRQTIEASLITLFHTTRHTKANSSVKDMDIIGPIILGVSAIECSLVAVVQLHLSLLVVPYIYILLQICLVCLCLTN